MRDKKGGLAGRFLPLATATALVLIVAVATWAAPGAGSAGRALATHDSVACNDGVPAGWSCVPLVNKPSSGPGVSSPAIGELLFKFADADTLWVSVRALPGQGAVEAAAQFCLDDDNEPFSEPTTGPGDNPHDCTGAAAGAVQVTDGTSGIPDASPAEPDDDSAAGLDGQYEIRITGIATDGTADGLTFAEFNNIDGYGFFVYHVNIGASSTQAFFQATAPPPTPTPTPTPGPGATPTPTPPPPLAEVRAPVALPDTGDGPTGGGLGGALLWLGALGAAAAIGGGLWFAYRTVRIK